MSVDELIAYLLELTELEPAAGRWTVHTSAGAKVVDAEIVPGRADVRLVVT